jgi:hypothetical protein
MWVIRYKSGHSGKESEETRGERKVERMQPVCPSSHSHYGRGEGADGSVPRRRGRVAEVASSTIDVETTSAENEGDLATA